MCYSEDGSSASGQVLPIMVIEPAVFGGRVRVYAFGRESGDWARLHEKPNLYKHLAKIVKGCGVKDIYIRFPKASLGVVAKEPVFSLPMVESEGVRLHFGMESEGAFLRKPSAFFVAPADCKTLIMQLPNGVVIATHAGRESLIEPPEVRGKSENYRSVVTTALEGYYMSHGIRSSVVFGIKPKSFLHRVDDLKWGAENLARTEHVMRVWGSNCIDGPKSLGALDLAEVARSQLASLGVQVDESVFFKDDVDTFADKDDAGKYIWHSHRRGDLTRNGVLVVRLP